MSGPLSATGPVEGGGNLFFPETRLKFLEKKLVDVGFIFKNLRPVSPAYREEVKIKLKSLAAQNRDQRSAPSMQAG